MTEVIQSETIFAQDSLAVPWRVAISANTLIATNPYGRPKLYAIDISRRKRLRVVRSTSGRDEFEYPNEIAVSLDSAKLFYVSDVGRGTITPVGRVGDTVVVHNDRAVTLKTDLPIRSMQALRGGGFVVTGAFPDHMLRLVDADGRVHDSFGPLVSPLPMTPMGVAAVLAEARLKWDLARRRLLLLGVYSGLGGWVDSSGRVVSMLSTPDTLEPRYGIRFRGQASSPIIDPSTQIGYLDAVMKPGCVIALYSGRPLTERAKASAGTELHAFSPTDGKLIARFTLDQDFASLAIDAEFQYLYGAQWSPRPAIARMKAPSCTRAER